ncbi:MAG: choice-of-anchor L domain-containing protein [Pseudomonadota bacterium]
MVNATELPINTGATALDMANEIFGGGVAIVSASYSGAAGSSGIYSDGDAVSPGVVPGDTGIILSTGNATDFTNTTGEANQATNTSSNTAGVDNDADFNALAGRATFDASFLTIDFIPTGGTLTMQFVFGSDEYPEYSNSIYNDAVGVWINGSNVPLSVGTGQSSIGNVNQNNNVNLYNDNTADQFNTEMDGFTVTLTLTINVTPNVVNTLKVGIADVGDSSFDSNLLIAAGSLQTEIVANDDTLEMQPNKFKDIDVTANDTNTAPGSLTITHINGQPVVVGTTITLPTGETVTLQVNGWLRVGTDTDFDDVNFTYTIENSNGQTDTGIVNLDTIPCFVSGTLIETETGERLVETLRPGDRIRTRDNGYQPLRWTGQRVVQGQGKLAPIRMLDGALGNHRTLMVSPNHRVLLEDARAEILFGEPEVLVSAKHLVNDCSIRPVESAEVAYVHLLFEDHQVVYSEGLATESFLPGPQTVGSFEAEIMEELAEIFTEFDAQSGTGYGPAAKRVLKAHEADLLRA